MPERSSFNKNDDKSAVLSFNSFDGGGSSYTAKIENPEILTHDCKKYYSKPNHSKLCGSCFNVVFTFSGLREGKTKVHITSNSPIIPSKEFIYEAKVDCELRVFLNKITTQ